MILEKFKEEIAKFPENLVPKDFRLSMSSAGECQLKLERSLQNPRKPIEFKSYMYMEAGTMIHTFLQGLLKRVFGDAFYGAEEQVTLTLDGFDVDGHPDGILKLDRSYLAEIKSVGTNIFQKIVRQGAPLDQHIEQGNGYAVALGIEWVWIVYFNRDTFEFVEFIFESSESQALEVVKKFRTASENAKAGVLSPRPYNDKTEAPCWYCPWSEECYKGFKEEIASLTRKAIDDEEVSQLARRAIKLRNIRLTSTKSEDEIKVRLGSLLKDQFLTNQAHIKDGKGLMIAEVKSGKNDNLLCTVKEKK